MITIDEKRFRERIDETYPFDKTSQERHGIADIAKGEILRLLAEEQRTGRWIEIAKYSDGQHKIGCSECGGYIFDRGHANSFNVHEKYKYCPNCGAKMEGNND